VSTDALISILQQIRDQQKEQIVNYERALKTQEEAIALQRRGRRTLLFLIIMPWVLALSLLILYLVNSFFL
jgi:hypothetical protein